MKPHLEKLVAEIKNLELVNRACTEDGPRRPMVPEGAAQLRYLMNAGLRLDPWIMVWQSMQGCSSADPAFIP